MELKINSAKVGKRGTNNYGDWALVVLDTDKGDWTTLSKEAESIQPGMTIKIDKISMDEKDGKEKKSFKEFAIISGATSTGPDKPAPENGKVAMTPTDWDRKDRLQSQSIESQTAFKGIIELLVAKVIEPSGELGKSATDWAFAKLTISSPSPAPSKAPKATTEPKKQPGSATDKAFEQLGEEPTFKHAGEFVGAVNAKLGIYSAEICERLGVNDIKEVKDFEEAWETLTGKKATTSEDGTFEPEDIPFD